MEGYPLHEYAYIDDHLMGSPNAIDPDIGGSLIEGLNASVDLGHTSRMSFSEAHRTSEKQIKDIRNVLHANLHGGSWDRDGDGHQTDEYNEHVIKIRDALATFRGLLDIYQEQNEKVVRIEASLKQSAEDTKVSLKTIHAFSVFLNSLSTQNNVSRSLTGPGPEPEPELVLPEGIPPRIRPGEDYDADREDDRDADRVSESHDIVEIQRKIVKVAESIEARDKTKVLKDAYLKELAILKLYIHTFFKEINGINVGNTCSLCLQRPVTKYLNPCGHTGCSECLEKMGESSYTTHCFLCRKRVDSYHPLYFC